MNTTREEHQAMVQQIRDDIAEVFWQKYGCEDNDQDAARKKADHVAGGIMIVCNLHGLRIMR